MAVTDEEWQAVGFISLLLIFIALMTWMTVSYLRTAPSPEPGIVWESPEMTEKAIAQANQYRYMVEEWYPTLGVWMQPLSHRDKGVVGWPSKKEAIRSAEDLYLATGKRYRVRDKGEKR